MEPFHNQPQVDIVVDVCNAMSTCDKEALLQNSKIDVILTLVLNNVSQTKFEY